jgi:hypothetical protein
VKTKKKSIHSVVRAWPCVAAAAAALLVLMAPAAQAIPTLAPFDLYGGRVNVMGGVAVDPLNSEIFVGTESPNSLYVAQVSHAAGPPVVGDFERVAGMTATDNHGTPQTLAVYRHPAAASTCVYVGVDMKIYYALYDVPAASGTFAPLTFGTAGPFPDFAPIVATPSGYLFIAWGSDVYWGTIQPNCTVAWNAGAPRPVVGMTDIDVMAVGKRFGAAPADEYVYVGEFKGAGPAPLAHGDDPVASMNGTTTFANFSAPADFYETMDVSPDGKVWLGGYKLASHDKWVASLDWLAGPWVQAATGIMGHWGPIRAYDDGLGSYRIYLGTARSDDAGATWTGMCMSSFETHPNDGDNLADPNNPLLVFMTTDQGIGMSENAGADCVEHDSKIEAVKIQSIWVNDVLAPGVPAKSMAWIAGKSGVRISSNFNAFTPTWTNAVFPTGDGSPYYSVEVDPTLPADHAFSANVRVYRTTTGGLTDGAWTQMFSEASYGATMGGMMNGERNIRALAIDPFYTTDTAIYAGLESNWEPDMAGGLYASCDDGGTWQQVGLSNTPPSQDANVWDILVNKEGAQTVVYVAADHTPSGGVGPAAASWGVYRIADDCSNAPSSWTATQQFAAPKEIYSLDADANGVVYAAGETTLGAPVVYENASGTFSAVTVAGLAADPVRAIVLGDRPLTGACPGLIPYVAVGLKVYYLDMDLTCTTYDASWTFFYEHFNGGAINTMFWDELLIGGDTGLRSLAEEDPGPAGIPTLSEWALILLLTMMAMVAVWRLREGLGASRTAG